MSEDTKGQPGVVVTVTTFDDNGRASVETFTTPKRPVHCPQCTTHGVAIPKGCPHIARAEGKS